MLLPKLLRFATQHSGFATSVVWIEDLDLKKIQKIDQQSRNRAHTREPRTGELGWLVRKLCTMATKKSAKKVERLAGLRVSSLPPGDLKVSPTAYRDRDHIFSMMADTLPPDAIGMLALTPQGKPRVWGYSFSTRALCSAGVVEVSRLDSNALERTKLGSDFLKWLAALRV